MQNKIIEINPSGVLKNPIQHALVNR